MSNSNPSENNDLAGGLNWSESLNDTCMAITVYDSDSLFAPEERVDVQVFNNKEESIVTFPTEKMLFQNTICFGRGDNQDCQFLDDLMSREHCTLNFNKWFKKKRKWVQIYKLLLNLERKLPVSVCKLIASYFWEPRCVVLEDKGSMNGTLVSLKPSVPYPLLEKQRYMVSENLEMIVGDQEQFTDDDFGKSDEANKKAIPKPVVVSDNLLAEEGENNVYQVLSIHFKQFNTPNISFTFKLMSNRNTARFLVGKSLDANVRVLFDKVDENQCEIVLENGQWYFCEWNHEHKNQRSWLNIQGEKNCQKEITEDTEILVADNSIKLTF